MIALKKCFSIILLSFFSFNLALAQEQTNKELLISAISNLTLDFEELKNHKMSLLEDKVLDLSEKFDNYFLEL